MKEIERKNYQRISLPKKKEKKKKKKKEKKTYVFPLSSLRWIRHPCRQIVQLDTFSTLTKQTVRRRGGGRRRGRRSVFTSSCLKRSQKFCSTCADFVRIKRGLLCCFSRVVLSAVSVFRLELGTMSITAPAAAPAALSLLCCLRRRRRCPPPPPLFRVSTKDRQVSKF